MDKNKEKLAKDRFTWTWKGALPYLVAVIIPTVLLILGYIGQIVWVSTFLVLIVGVGMVELESLKIAGNSIDFDHEDGKEETKN